MDCKMSILDEKYINFTKWVNSIKDQRGPESTLTIKQVCDMLDLLDKMETKTDKIILDTFGMEPKTGEEECQVTANY